ncbi:unnamed protein product [Protopolystoma xenopodis]|uniref:E3 ubiquitin ligase UBR4 C-terminal domain-containing protein n=1 Tax=Protopolystoma xenopodis TaxID=117903 RepID=A0A3S5BEN6_9PLAT|nr:unnamed protein product [Protopolystoma xenopodis]
MCHVHGPTLESIMHTIGSGLVFLLGQVGFIIICNFLTLQVTVLSVDKVAKMTAELQEETGLKCAICHEGPRNVPKESLGIYIYASRHLFEEDMSNSVPYSTSSGTHSAGTSASSGLPSNISSQIGYQTLTSFVVVHFSCHTNFI